MLDDDGLSMDTALCDGCGLCVPACPRAAISPVLEITTIFDPRGRGEAWVACEFAPQPDELKIGCLHALGVRDFDRLAGKKVRTLHVLSGDCDGCPRSGSTQDIQHAARNHAHMRTSRNQPVTSLIRHEPEAFERTLARARRQEAPIDRKRRGLFAAFLDDRAPSDTAPAAVGALAYHAPAIDRDRCIACDACIHLCPDGALRRLAGPPPAYVLAPDACSGCGLCVDACDQHAISVQQMAAAQETRISLDSSRCTACGAPYDRIADAPGKGGNLCRICVTTAHHKKLFQVIGSP